MSPYGPDRGSSPDEPYFEADPDEDTGPVHVIAPHDEDDWGDYSPPLAQEIFANRFDTPLTVDPRAPRVKSSGIRPSTVLAVAGAVVLVVVLIFVLFRVFDGSESADTTAAPTTTSTPELSVDQQKLERLLPAGYGADACSPATAPADALAKLTCAQNSDAGGPPSATYVLVADKSALDAMFNGLVKAARVVNCPGSIQSPGAWRRNATPQLVSGTLFCGFRQNIPTVAWTSDADSMISAVDGAANGPNLDQLYVWWSSHS